LGTRIRRPQRERGACQEKEKDDTCFSMADPGAIVHAPTPPDKIFFPIHRQPPFSQAKFASSSNEPYIEVRIRDRNPSVTESSDSLFEIMNFDNVILIAPPFSRVFRENTT
jgi:hypothetical protein